MGIPALTLEPEDAGFPLPSAVNGQYTWMCASFTQDCLWTDGPTQYAVWVDDNRKARIARRTHTRGWEPSIDLSTVAATALSAQFTLDSHNAVTVAVDDRGYVHVAGDMHAVALKYMRTAQPGSLDSWVAGDMVGTEESQVTYPQFVRTPRANGALHFFYRDGGSGDGDLLLNKFNSATRTWSRVAQVIQGKVDNWSAYPQHIAIDRNSGRWHLLWTWRLTGTGAEGNENFCYAYSDNEGVTWRNTAGTAYTLPITKATGEVVIAMAAGPILNNGGLEIDSSGHPHAAVTITVGPTRKLHHIYHDGAIWHIDQVTTYQANRAAVACFTDGRVLLVFGSGSPTAGGHLRVVDVTDPANPVESVLYGSNRLDLEATIDSQALYLRNRLYVAAPMERDAGPQGGDPGDLGVQLQVPVLAIR